ncbi:hypothetical protein ACFLXI_00760 [Chloroflexota bacterium]
MKKYALYIVISLIVILFTLSACERSQSTPPPVDVPSQTPGVLTQLPDALASQTAAFTALPTTQLPTSTNVPDEPTSEPTSEPPTVTEEQPEATVGPSLEPLTKTPLPATTTPSGSVFDPSELYGEPTMVDPMDSSSIDNWKSSGVLPDSEYIRISLSNDQIYITGKKSGFSTWFFSWPTLKNFYIELIAHSGDCSGKDEYGLIVRGPAHGAGVSYGYIIAFSCDGNYSVTRLDSADPFSTTDLISQRQSDRIRTGSGQQNLIGIKADGSKFTIFANGYQVAEVSDNTFLNGRYGLFVQAVDTAFYTYQPEQIAYWVLE